MIESLIKILPKVYEDMCKEIPSEWDSLIINRRKPWTYRIFRKYGNLRICLHTFEPCSEVECFIHPHPWPGAFLILKGSYKHTIGYSDNLFDKPTLLYSEILCKGSTYEIIDPKIWHSVQPLERTYTIMVNGPPFKNPHKEVRTTKGKDLEKMSEEEVKRALTEFKWFLLENI